MTQPAMSPGDGSKITVSELGAPAAAHWPHSSTTR